MKIRDKAYFNKLETVSHGRDLNLTPLVFAIAAAFASSPAFAEQGAAEKAATPAPKSEIQEVVITAEKRGSTVRKTPISISAVSGDDLMERGITSTSQLARETPGVAAKSSGPGQTEYSIRGMSSSAGVSATVGFYLDEIPVSPPTLAAGGKAAIDPDLYDLARVEILRGPQGTLYGDSSMGGTIKVVPNEPKLNKLEGSVQLKGSATEGGGPNGTANAMINVPVVADTAALRVVVTKKHNSGWIDRAVVTDFPIPSSAATGSLFSAPRPDVAAAPVTKTYTDVNTESLDVVRASMLIKATDKLTIVPSLLYQRTSQGGPDTYDASPGNNVHYQPFDVAEPFMDRYAIASVKITYDTDAWSLVSATAYSKRTRRQTQDASEITLKTTGDTFGVYTYPAAQGGFGYSVVTETNPTRQLTQELRLSSNGPGPVKWLAGAYFSELKSAYLVADLAPEAAPVLGTTNVYSADIGDRIKQSALFGNLSYDLLPTLRATAGLRYFKSSDKASSTSTGYAATNTSETSATDQHGYNPMFNLAYTPNANAMWYATAAKGFRDGAAQGNVPSFCASDLAALGLTRSPARYAPDTVWSYELGSKTRVLDGKLDVNAAVYQMKWNNMQQVVVLPGCGYTFTDNVAAAKISGLEIEAKARITRNLVWEQAIGYAHARVSSAASLSSTKVGDKLLNVPAFTASTSLRHSWEIDENRTFVTRFNASYVGPQESLTAQRTTMPGYTMMGLRAGVQTDGWTFAVFVDNLANKKVALGNTQSLTINTPGLDRTATARPRTIGIDYSHGF